MTTAVMGDGEDIYPLLRFWLEYCGRW